MHVNWTVHCMIFRSCFSLVRCETIVRPRLHYYSLYTEFARHATSSFTVKEQWLVANAYISLTELACLFGSLRLKIFTAFQYLYKI